MQNSRLDESEIQKIKTLARNKLNEYQKLNDVIGAQIFSILEKESKLLYYPLDDQHIWGFSEIIQGKPFVCINTSIQYDKQVFAAAHELYHLWYGNSGEIMISKDAIEPDTEIKTELVANRFAAEFLVAEELLMQEMHVFGIDKNNLIVKDVVRLANHFLVPYHTIARRLFETDICSFDQLKKYMSYTEEHVNIWRNRLGLSLPVRKDKIGLSNLIDMAIELYENGLITYEKLEYLLEFSNLTPDSVGILQNRSYTPPTDIELDAILE